MPDSGDTSAGSLAIVLHSHMPYVEGFGTYPFGEEWLFDAVIRSYLPVLEIAEHLTMTITPVLADQLEAGGVPERLRSFAAVHRVEAARAEARAIAPELRAACAHEAERYAAALARLEELDGDLLGAFRGARARDVELVPSTATHAVLPLLASEASRRLQIESGVRSHRRRFGRSRGFWLPECAYSPGLERLLAECGVEHFCVDQSSFEAPLDALAPIATREGPVALPVDWEAVGWLWSLQGYPSDPLHADFHRKSLQGVRAWAIDGEPYRPDAAARRARAQGAEFVAALASRLRTFAAQRGRRGLVVFAIDTELLGHWWSEGPLWLAEVLRLAPAAGIHLVTLGEGTAQHPPEAREVRPATWGEGKDLRTWDSTPVADLAWAARRLELRVLAALGGGVRGRSAERAVRELLAIQASDWAFLDSRRQAGDYPYQRVTLHAEALLAALAGDVASSRLRALAPDLRIEPLLSP